MKLQFLIAHGTVNNFKILALCGAIVSAFNMLSLFTFKGILHHGVIIAL